MFSSEDTTISESMSEDEFGLLEPQRDVEKKTLKEVNAFVHLVDRGDI